MNHNKSFENEFFTQIYKSIKSEQSIHCLYHLSYGWYGTSCIGCHCIAGQQKSPQPYMHTLIPMGNLKRPLNLTDMFLTMRGSRSTLDEPMNTQGEHTKPMQKDPRLRLKPRTFLLQGNSSSNHTTLQPIRVVIKANGAIETLTTTSCKRN